MLEIIIKILSDPFQYPSYIGLVLILVAVKSNFSRKKRQTMLGSGAGLLTIGVLFPQPYWIFVILQIAASSIGFLNIKDVPWRGNLKKCIIILAIISGVSIGIIQSAGINTYIGILSLICITLGYGSKPEPQGKQNSLFLIGGILMIIFSAVEFFILDIYQAVPFLILNILFSYFSFEKLFKK